ncbi:Mobile element protein [bacterium endosymbiont of Bathymodiolus sp. 5 South]|nr:Mobile element protein [bacterium endosymbiont of Bathymodiolus sp. 5 South]
MKLSLFRDLCINRNNHHKPTFHPLGDFLNPALALARARFKET